MSTNGETPSMTHEGGTPDAPRVACVGIYILDVLGRAIDELPTTQRSLIIDEIRMTVAGTAGGTAVDLARLGADVLAVGAVGQDSVGAFVRTVLQQEGVDVSGLVVKPGVPTSATMLPISSAGVRPAWHVRGANAELGPADLPWDALARVDVLHYGGVSALPGLDGDPSCELLSFARAHGALTTADCLGVKRPDALELFAASLQHVDVFMPNRDEVALLTGVSSPYDGARAILDLGPRAVLVKLDAEGCFGVTAEGEFSLPAIPGPIVDSTGCGDAFCAGVIRGLSLGWPLEKAAELGIASGTLTAGGLGSDAGLRDLDSTLAFLDGHRGTRSR
ncbi:carbohydrate kinase family protein [Blastococcus sp. SYSU DS0539]